MVALEVAVAGCREAHTRLGAAVVDLTERQMRVPSLLPGWTVGHVLTHLARNADSVTRRLHGAADGLIVDQYPGGAAGRAAEIEAGAARGPAELIDDVIASAARVDQLLESLAPEVWDRPARSVDGTERPARGLPWARWREVEIHLVDLGIGITFADTPESFMAPLLDELLARLPQRTLPAELAAWLLGRGDAPQLRTWG